MIVAILQARMSSTRLPGKVLMPLVRQPMIVRQIERVARARRIDKLVVATSDGPEDDPIEKAVLREGIPVFRGSLHDVQDRFLGALDAHPAEHLVRLTADCPLADPDLIDATIDLCLSSAADYANNTAPGRAWPKGTDIEVVRAAALREAAKVATPEAREHVTWDIRMQPERWRQVFLACHPDQGAVRWTVDRPDDYAFVAAVYDALYPKNRTFTSDDVRAFVRDRPDLADYGGDRRV
ncbi:cytidylyltransferase domain-containing protein [Caulobacter segnis]|uniref:Flagellin modification protein FlmC n=1 Tax=Caulobacter segnis TaxID=88688 RepID=A0A2W5V3R4_9CAUL|nr:NTP transferase domain-containing protein [Caulobacter segnis]PZR33942.1 MAG: flagellin modification protein FlmC [Caulobacter segnis]